MPGYYTRGRIGIFRKKGRRRARYYNRGRRTKGSVVKFKRRFNPQIGFPSTTYVKMRYVQTITLAPAFAGLFETIFLANGLFDPYVPLGGHQPLGHDQWAQFYNKYVVYRSRCKVSYAVGNSPGIGSAPILGIYLSAAGSTTATTVNELQEQGKSNYIQLSQTTNGNAVTMNNSLYMTYNAKKWHNITNVKDADNLEASFGADPTDLTYFNIYYGNSSPTSGQAPPNIEICVQIDYYVLCKDPKELAQS